MIEEPARRRFRPDIWHVVLALPLLALGVRAHVPIRDNSFLWHIGAGRAQIDSGAVLTTDPFSFTRGGEPWRTQSWLADVWYGWMDSWAGLAYVPWFVYGVGALSIGAVMLVGYRLTRRVEPAAVLGVLTTVITIAFLNPRPVIFSFLLFALVVLAEHDRRLRWALPLLFWLWASLHGSFVVGGAYVLVQAVRRRKWDAWRELAVIGVAVTLTAHGWGVWETLYRFFSHREGLSVITEWRAPDLLTVPMLPLSFAIVLFVWAGITDRLRLRDLILFVPFFALALSASRAVPPAWIALTPLVAASLKDLRFTDRTVTARRGRVHTLMGLIIVSAPFVVPLDVRLDNETFAVDAVEHLTEERVFHSDTDGGYLIYAKWPERLVYVDDRAELYGDMLGEFLGVRNGDPMWMDVFDRYGIEEVMVAKKHTLVHVLDLAGWSRTYEDDVFVVMRPG